MLKKARLVLGIDDEKDAPKARIAAVFGDRALEGVDGGPESFGFRVGDAWNSTVAEIKRLGPHVSLGTKDDRLYVRVCARPDDPWHQRAAAGWSRSLKEKPPIADLDLPGRGDDARHVARVASDAWGERATIDCDPKGAVEVSLPFATTLAKIEEFASKIVDVYADPTIECRGTYVVLRTLPRTPS